MLLVGMFKVEAWLGLVSLLIFISLGWCDKPNIVLVLTDDQDVTLGGFTQMKKTQQLLANAGMTFNNAFVSTPVCCPSRSSILTGLYSHNHLVVNNSVAGGCSSPAWQESLEKQSFAVHLQQLAGYRTFYAGKYLNQYGEKKTGGAEHVPPGWHSWVGLIGNSKYFDYNVSVNGTNVHFEDKYLTTLIAEESLKFLDNQLDCESPFLMVLAPPAPHAPFSPEPKYEGHFNGSKVPRTLQFNWPHNEDKHWLVRMMPQPLSSETVQLVDAKYSRRLETLLSVDDLVESLVNKLNQSNRLENTYITFTSDNGYHLGQFSLPWDKRQPYEFDIRVPLVVRGPGIPKKSTNNSPVLNIDLAPTILHLAGLSEPQMDGVAFLPPVQWTTRSFAIEYQGEGKKSKPLCPTDSSDLYECTPEAECKCEDSRNNTYSCVRTLAPSFNYLYCKFYDSDNFIELYNLDKDPYQLANLATSHSVPPSLLVRLEQLTACSSSQCHLFE